MENELFRFKVNLGGMIEILSDHLYSSPDVYIRELLQNGTDAIVARQKSEEGFENSEIRIKLVPNQSLAFHDNGTGLTRDEVHRFLAIIGESSKKDLMTGRVMEEYIGRFGIGLLSCFMVSDEIVIETRSIRENTSLRWTGKPDGTYTLTEIPEGCEEGTTIILNCKEGKEQYFTSQKVKQLISYYGILLPFPVVFDDGSQNTRMNRIYLPWDERQSTKEELMFFGKTMFGQDFLDCIPLKSESGNVSGVAYILPYQVNGAAKNYHRIFLKNMLLTEKGDSILPEWAVFVKCIINATNLRPTASREDFYEDELLEEAREEIGVCISDYIANLARTDLEMMDRFLSIHQRVLKAMAIENDELYRLFFQYFDFVTTRGRMTGRELLLQREPLVYTGQVDEFKQMSQIFFAQGRLLINAGYVYDKEILCQVPVFYNAEVMELQEEEVVEIMNDVTISETETGHFFLLTADRVLAKYDCRAEMKKFSPVTLPAFYYIDKQALFLRKIQSAKEASSPLFAGMLSAFAKDIKKETSAYLYFNYYNPVVKKLCLLENVEEIERFVEILYIQTILIGGYPMHNNEMGILNGRIMELIERNLLDD